MREKVFEPGTLIYDSCIASNYPAARAFSTETADTWFTVLQPFITPSLPLTVLDLGCGTGRFSTLIAQRFGVHVIGLDPSFGMLEAAMRQSTADNISYAVASAEQIPLSESSCQLAWLSQVIHHISDRDACARELRRVLRPGGLVLIRGTFGDRLDGFPTLFGFFPGARQIATEFPAIAEVMRSFASAGFSLESIQRVEQTTCGSLAEFASRTRLRADSTLVLLSDSEYERGQSELERAAARESEPSPVIETLDLVVLRAATHPRIA